VMVTCGDVCYPHPQGCHAPRKKKVLENELNQLLEAPWPSGNVTGSVKTQHNVAFFEIPEY